MTIFHEPWWLDAVAPDQWREVSVRDGGVVAVRWPYLERSGPLGLRRVLSPPLSPRLGPLFDAELESSLDLGSWSSLLSETATLLPDTGQFLQSCHPGLHYWTPLEWQGFRGTTHFSFVIRPEDAIETVRARYNSNRRRDLKKAKGRIEVRRDLPVHLTYAALQRTLSRSGKAPDYDCELLERVHEAATDRGRGVHLAAVDQNGTFLAGVFLVWDEARAYYLVVAATDEARGTGAQTLLVDEAVTHALGNGRLFDFEGSRIESIEQFFRSFGSTPEPYVRVERLSPAAELALLGRKLAMRGRQRVRAQLP